MKKIFSVPFICFLLMASVFINIHIDEATFIGPSSQSSIVLLSYLSTLIFILLLLVKMTFGNKPKVEIEEEKKEEKINLQDYIQLDAKGKAKFLGKVLKDKNQDSSMLVLHKL
ncbi:hypothetical protein [Flexithrix dorotheae]|uniref:hypothetical protein n=1 Tax=Flexithrix dorotheae TaxID=70993 RepID=UPI0003A65CCE|nr:hypothetical protein [Flexithrix dorotheae]